MEQKAVWERVRRERGSAGLQAPSYTSIRFVTKPREKWPCFITGRYRVQVHSYLDYLQHIAQVPPNSRRLLHSTTLSNYKLSSHHGGERCWWVCGLILGFCPVQWATWWCSWFRYCATSRQVAGSIPDGVNGILHWHNPAGRTMALGST